VATPGVDFFRVDRSGPTKRLLAVAGLLVGIGGSSVGAHLVHRLPDATGHTLSLAGGITMALGLILGFGAMAMIVFEDVYLLIQRDGVLLHDNGNEISIPWADLETVGEEHGFLLLTLGRGDVIRWFAGRSAGAIRARLLEARRKAIHGLLA
jgi:hypothetical protein